MPSLLVILLTISLIIVGAGLILSYKPRAKVEHSIPLPRNRREVIVVDSLPPRPRMRAIAQSKQLIERRSPVIEGRYRGASVALPLAVDHDFDQFRPGTSIPWMRMFIGLLIAFLFVCFFMNILQE